MPWYIDELYSTVEIDWDFAPDQELSDRLSQPETIPSENTWPLTVVQRSNLNALPDYATGPVTGIVFVSKNFKSLVEKFDPVKHHFVPLVIEQPSGQCLSDTHYLFKLGSFVENGIIVEQSDVREDVFKGKLWRYLKTSQAPRLMWCASAIEGRHIWADSLLSHAVIVSDDLYVEMENLGMRAKGTFQAIESRISTNE